MPDVDAHLGEEEMLSGQLTLETSANIGRYWRSGCNYIFMCICNYVKIPHMIYNWRIDNCKRFKIFEFR